MMPTVRPVLRQSSRTSSARARWSSAVPCEKFIRTTSTPARNIRSSTAGSLEAGPRVATIFGAAAAGGARFREHRGGGEL